MSLQEGERTVTLVLAPDVYERAVETAQRQGAPVEKLLATLVDEALERKERLRIGWERLSDSYRERLTQEGTLDQSPEEVLADLRELREQVARELYP